MSNIKIGEKLRFFREKCGYSMQELADEVLISKMSIYYYEKNMKIPGADILFRICQKLNITPNDLFYNKENIILEEQIKEYNEKIFSLKIQITDDSNYPILKKDEIALIKKDEKITNKVLFLIEDSNKNLIIRYMIKTENTIQLIPQNLNYSIIEYDEKNHKIIGKVIGKISYFDQK
ncbi:LexA family transcriptional regulator [Oceanotoga sp. DSM 15011]|uniref:LexA family transcriptional regulator n=1 Tax=Oceanotoga sp. DSM 15011 TaxID=2984951 RepID=UPI0021F3F8E7|nr:LexA family transcriptional regulator [Oceanotoga sp. DSM 15011]UYP01118.1 LexA family transcriptional regulator [Oceanotoga sp. DSM 15011]